MILKYKVGGGYIPGIPARDLLQADIDNLVGVFFIDEADAISQLTKQGLYSTVKKSTKKTPTLDSVEDDS